MAESAGASRSHGSVDILPGEGLVWEGPPSPRGILAVGLSSLLQASLIALLLFLLFGFAFFAETAAAEEGPGAGLFWGAMAIVAVVLGALTLISVVWCWLRNRGAWYVVTTERICIQTGALQKTIVSIDLDKIISVKATQGLAQRLFSLQSIELTHAGWPGTPGKAVWFNPYELQNLPVSDGLYGRLVNQWLPRDNRRGKVAAPPDGSPE